MCEESRTANAARVSEGIAMLQKAIEERPDYDDAMVFLHLLYLRRADMQCGDLKAQVEDRRLSEKLVDDAMAARKRRAHSVNNPVEPFDAFDRKSGVVRSACFSPFPER